jgi:hypothetical protein
MRRQLSALVVIALSTAAVTGQTQSRVATTRTLLMQNPLFFHNRQVAFTDTPRLADGVWRIPVEAGKTLAVVFHTAPTTDGPVEIRGTFVDVGRFAPDDSRITAYSLQPVVQAIVGPDGAWPARETLFAVVNATSGPPEDPGTPSMRAIAMFPERFDGKLVTLRGRFRGRNLMGDLPSWPRQSQSDFVLQAADGAVWVTGLKPKGKGFDLDTSARRDIGRWLEVSGTMSVVEGLPMLRATKIAASAPEDDAPVKDDRPIAPPLPPPAINFSVPTEGEIDIAPDTTVQVQFSRDMKATSFEGHVRVTCTENGTSVPAPAFTTTYRTATLSVQIKFAAPLPRFATIVVEFLEGITAPDGTPLPPGKVTFSTGG